MSEVLFGNEWDEVLGEEFSVFWIVNIKQLKFIQKEVNYGRNSN